MADQEGDIKILAETEEYEYHKKFRMVRARLQFRLSDGQMSEPVTRLALQRGNTVGVLLYDPAQDLVLLVRQFRYPVYAADARGGNARGAAAESWLVETVAGVQEEGQTAEETARREVSEEVGYDVRGDLQKIAEVYLSPGILTERMTIFMAEVDSQQKAGQGGGMAAEGEDTALVVLPREEALDMLARGEIKDAKTVIALQYLAANRDR